MDLSAPSLRDALCRIDIEGWDGSTGRHLLQDVRRAVVVPVVRGSGLRGPAADQAEATGWAAAWDAMRRPTARTALNPGGMIWTAVRRAVAAEGAFTRNGEVGAAVAGSPAIGPVGTRSVHRPDGVAPPRPGVLSLDHLMDEGWQCAAAGEPSPVDSGPVVTAVLDGLVEAGWERQ